MLQTVLLDQPLVSDRITNVVMILFVLSLIAERLANFIKLNFPEKSAMVKTLFGVDFLNMRTKADTVYEEKRREKRILWIALFSGFLIALAFKANLIEILQSQNGDGLGWHDKALWDYEGFDAFKLLLGCLLTGFFISMGSKFWHDLLDIVLAIKNTKNKLADPELYRQQSADAVDEYLKTSYDELVDKAINKYSADLAKIPGVLSFMNKDVGGGKNVLHIKIASAEVEKQLPEFKVALPSGRSMKVPYETEVGKVGKIQAGPASLIMSKSEAPDKVRKGAFGCVVKKKDVSDGKSYLLTCYHVIKLSGDSWSPPLAYNTPNELVYVNEQNAIASVKQVARDAEMDIAFAELTHALDNSGLGLKPGVRTLTRDDARKELPLKIKSPLTNAEKKGKLQFHKISVRLEYDENNIFLLNNLVAVSDAAFNNNFPMSVPGDSGSILMDDNNVPAAMIVGADDNYSYAIPLDRILANYNYMLV